MNLNISINMVFSPPQEGIQFYRVPHDIERFNWNSKDFRYGGDGYRNGPVRGVVSDGGKPQPEVYRLDPDIHVILDCACQWMWKNLNPKLSGKKWSTLLGSGLAWTNNTGFPYKKNCITGEWADKPFPRFDQQRTCGGAILCGYEKDGLLYIESLRNNSPLPTTQEILSKPWLWYWGTSVNPEGEPNVVTRTGMDGNEYGVIIPNLTATQTTLPLTELDKLPIGSPIPPPTWLP